MNEYKVLLPPQLWRQHRPDYLAYQSAAMNYMKRYPHYVPVRIEKGFAICKRQGELWI